MPIFALSNAGVTLSGDFTQSLQSPVTIGVIVALLLGKLIGVSGTALFLQKLKIITIPSELTTMHIIAAGFLCSIGFTMSLFIASLAFTNPEHLLYAKIGILTASITGGLIAFVLLKKSSATIIAPTLDTTL
jgi:NhaA family Na+:H+ antiporter